MGWDTITETVSQSVTQRQEQNLQFELLGMNDSIQFHNNQDITLKLLQQRNFYQH
jgi:hypothetical protein